MKIKFLVLTSLLVASFILPRAVIHADGECSTSYGGTTVCEPKDLTINKMVQDPVSGLYVENVTTPKFSQGDKINFKLIVKNTSGETFKNVKVRDEVPDNVRIDDADMTGTNQDGKKDYSIAGDKRSVEFRLDQMTAGQTVEFFIFAHLVGPYPTDDSFCQDNWGYVTSDGRPNGDRNFARFCVQNKVLGTTTLPAAGAEDMLLMLPFAAAGLGGVLLMRKRS